jgi:hypothetical protein
MPLKDNDGHASSRASPLGFDRERQFTSIAREPEQ